MAKKKTKRRIPRFVYNDSTPKVLVAPEPEAPADYVKQLGTVKAALIGKHGSRGFSQLLAGLREQADKA